MEHYTERDSRWFRGREDAVAAVCELVEANPEVLLIGDSGIGKTSVVQAGVFPTMHKRDWIIASCRPLDAPDQSIPTAIWHQLMEGSPPPEESINTILNLVATAYPNKQVLVVIDQLEDIIPQLGTPQTSHLLAALAQTYASPPPNLHLLLCYRGDAEPKVGHYWQIASGSPSGLPRYYLGPITKEAAASVLADLLEPAYAARSAELPASLVEEIVVDTQAESTRSLGVQVYPPFLQMVVETILKSAENVGVLPDAPLYQSLGKARQIIGRYLANQLRMLGPRNKECKAILISLAGHRRRIRKSHDEITRDTNLPLQLVESCVADLVNLRLVRAIEDKYEIVHDFLAEKVAEDLVAPEEREARVFRDVLLAKAAAFANTGELLTFREHLGVYAHRQRIVPTPDEVELLFAGSLAGNGPVIYFLRSVAPELQTAWAEERLTSPDSTVQQNAYRFLLCSGRKYPLAVLLEVFSDYKLQAELAEFTERFATRQDMGLLLNLRRKKAERTRRAAFDQIEKLVGPADANVLGKLLRSGKSEDIRTLCRILIAKGTPSALPEYRREINKHSLVPRLIAICGLGAFGNRSDAELIQKRVHSRRLGAKERETCGHALAYWGQARRRRQLLLDLLGAQKSVCRGALGALEGDRGGTSIRVLLEQYTRLPFETAAAVKRTAIRRDLRELKKFLARTPLDASVRDILIGLLQVGGGMAARWAMNLIGKKDYQVSFWNVPLLTEVFARVVDRSIKGWLIELAESDEFWQYTWQKRGDRPLPVEIKENLYLVKRLLGVSLAALCDQKDWPLLKKLVFHDYWLVQVAAADRIAAFSGIEELSQLIEEARRRTEDQAERGVVYALKLLDAKLFGSQ